MDVRRSRSARAFLPKGTSVSREASERRFPAVPLSDRGVDMRYLWLFLLIIAFSSPAFGWGGKLSQPLFGYRDGLNAEQQKKAKVALAFMRDKLIFIDGQFINEFVSHRFGGTSQQTSRF